LSQREVVEISVDLELAVLTPQEIEGAYRSLCAAMLLRAAQELRVVKQLSKGAIEARHITRSWLFQDGGLITLDDACDACNIDRRWYIDNVVEAADGADDRRKPVNQNHCFFGRRQEPVPA